MTRNVRRMSLPALLLACAAPTLASGGPVPAAGKLPAGDPSAFKSALGLGATDRSVAVANEPFSRAVSLNVPTRSRVWDGEARLWCPISAPISKGDTVLLTFWVKTVSPLDGSAQVTVQFEDTTERRERSCKATVSPPGQWTRIDVPFSSATAYAPGGAQLSFHFAAAAQTVELGAVSLLDYGQQVRVEDLPATRATYAGREPDAPWRKIADADIDRYRKSDASIVVMKAGVPLPGARVTVAMTRHLFPFGTCVSSQFLTDPGPDGVSYREKLTSLFTIAVPANDLKWPNWDSNRQRGQATVNWLLAHGLEVRGHNLIWQSWRFQSRDLQKAYNAQLASTPDARKWLGDAVDKHIVDEMTALRGKCVQWDVVNEGVDNHLFADVLGPEAVRRWFDLAHRSDPGAQLLVNEDASIYGQALPERIDAVASEVNELVRSGAPIGGVGLESHMSAWSLPSPDQVNRTLAAYTKIGLPATITEYDLKTNDKALEADYTRDFMTLCFACPNVNAFLIWGFWDGDHWLGDSPLFNRDWSLKPSGQAYMDLVFKKWRTRETGVTGSDGAYRFRGFQGDYAIQVSYGGKTSEATMRLGPGGAATVVRLD